MVALRMDLARDGQVFERATIEATYRAACSDGGYPKACEWSAWSTPGGVDGSQLAQVLGVSCSPSDPTACVVQGWNLEAQAVASNKPVLNLVDASAKYKDACDWGELAGCYELAELRAKGRGVPQMPDAALVLHKWTCNNGYLLSCVGWGQLIKQDPALESIPNSAGDLYRRACDAGLAEGCYHYGLLMESVWPIESTRSWHATWCEAGHAKACAALAAAYQAGTRGASLAKQTAAATRACNLNHAPSCIQVAAMQRDPQQAGALYIKACTLGETTACGLVGQLMASGDYGSKPSDSVSYLERGCRAGATTACATLGQFYLNGNFVKQNLRLAGELLQQGCSLGKKDVHAMACRGMGRMHEEGLGVPRDREIANRYYGLACQNNDFESCYRQGVLASSVPIGIRNDRLVLDAYNRACQGGYREACLEAAKLYEKGSLEVRDPSKALQRYDQLCNDGSSEACLLLGIAEEKGITGQVDYARARNAYDRGMALGDFECQRRYAHMLWYGRGGKKKKRKSKTLFREACAKGHRPACSGWR